MPCLHGLSYFLSTAIIGYLNTFNCHCIFILISKSFSNIVHIFGVYSNQFTVILYWQIVGSLEGSLVYLESVCSGPDYYLLYLLSIINLFHLAFCLTEKKNNLYNFCYKCVLLSMSLSIISTLCKLNYISPNELFLSVCTVILRYEILFKIYIEIS